MSIIAIGRHQYAHYHRLTDDCRLMTCNHAGVNVDYFTMVVRAAGLIATPYSREISDEVTSEYVNALSNGTADVGWALKRQDPTLLDKVELFGNCFVFFTFPVTGVTYGYVAREDRTEIRDSFITIFFHITTIIFVTMAIIVNLVRIVGNAFYLTKIMQSEGVTTPEVRSVRGFFTSTYALLKQAHRMESRTNNTRVLLSFYFLAALIFSQVFQSLITSVLASNKIRGYDVTSFSKLLDKIEYGGNKALIWPRFRLQTYCKGRECDRWNQLKATRTITAPDTSEDYFARLAQEPATLGFTALGDELLRGDVVIYDRSNRQLFIADQLLTRQPFSFMISKKRRDLVEKFNRAIVWTSPIYPRLMARYLSPYTIYSREISNNELTPLKLSNFDSVWPFFAVVIAIIVVVFILELVSFRLIRKLKK